MSTYMLSLFRDNFGPCQPLASRR
uniref:Uncharacterized protein n=1 Tax=Anguilla anguilla TaxID=7936 RepID=A0A0E9QFG3_ANGAN